ncbi:uncharacterized protein LOC108682228 [Hyalella azteca]|uniref:Uncharacterized protein LOC108682228 n=1 Tax=Hyalella azteca TaxID=294128 RepID=A0A979FWG8_HYAAZ|nr:uncharacterized protein LOC108682228 [Hyalella azteca]
MSLPTGHKILPLTKRQAEIDKLFKGHLAGAHTLQPDGWFFPTTQKKYCQEILDFEYEENDVVVMTMPKSGTTWTQEVVWTMRKNPNLDNPDANQPLHVRSPVLEADFLIDGLEDKGGFANLTKEQGKDPDKSVWLNFVRSAHRPRIIKTHLSFPFINETALSKAKIVYTIRDPRDVCISYHHHSRLFKYEGFTYTMSLPTGHKILPLTKRQAEIERLFKGHLAGAHTLHPDGWFFTTAQKKYCQEIRDFEFEENEVVVMTMPKSGTTWTQEVVWTMRKNPNLDNPDANQPLHVRSPILEADFVADGLEDKGTFAKFTKEQGKDPDKGVFLDIVRAAKKPRVIKTHLSFDFLNETALSKAKIVYTIRDPRDVCISYHHHSRLFKYEGFTGTFDEYVDAFIEGAVLNGPYWAHVKAAWDRRHLPNLHILFYEKMKKNPKEEFTKLSQFLGANLTEQQIDNVCMDD